MSRSDTALRYFEEHRGYTEERIAYGISQHRKGRGTVTVTDREGKPLAGVTLRLVLKNHEFRHGANIFMLEEMESKEKNDLYKDKFAQVFNLATVPFYWSDLEPIEGQPRYAKDSPKIYRRPATDLCVEFCEEKGIEPKCHCLNYDLFLPNWLWGKSVEEQKASLVRRFREIAQRYAHRIPSFEVTNETFAPHFDSPNCSAFFHEDDFVEWSFRQADRFFPNNRLIINDYALFDGFYRGNRSAYYMQIERMNRMGIRCESVGMQFHSFFPREEEVKMAQTRYNPLHLYRVLDTYAKLGKKLQITEMTLSAYGDSTEDEQVQAELLRWVYSVFFSHPAMEAIIYWNLVDGYAAFAPKGDMTAGENRFYGGLLRFDMSEKPAFRTLYDLFHREWHTDVTLVTDRDGRATLDGFYGVYDVVAEGEGIHYRGEASYSSTGRQIRLTL